MRSPEGSLRVVEGLTAAGLTEAVLVPDVGFRSLAESTELRGGDTNTRDAAGIERLTDNYRHKKNSQMVKAGRDNSSIPYKA